MDGGYNYALSRRQASSKAKAKGGGDKVKTLSDVTNGPLPKKRPKSGSSGSALTPISEPAEWMEVTAERKDDDFDALWEELEEGQQEKEEGSGPPPVMNPPRRGSGPATTNGNGSYYSSTGSSNYTGSYMAEYQKKKKLHGSPKGSLSGLGKYGIKQKATEDAPVQKVSPTPQLSREAESAEEEARSEEHRRVPVEEDAPIEKDANNIEEDRILLNDMEEADIEEAPVKEDIIEILVKEASTAVPEATIPVEKAAPVNVIPVKEGQNVVEQYDVSEESSSEEESESPASEVPVPKVPKVVVDLNDSENPAVLEINLSADISMDVSDVSLGEIVMPDVKPDAVPPPCGNPDVLVLGSQKDETMGDLAEVDESPKRRFGDTTASEMQTILIKNSLHVQERNDVQIGFNTASKVVHRSVDEVVQGDDDDPMRKTLNIDVVNSDDEHSEAVSDTKDAMAFSDTKDAMASSDTKDAMASSDTKDDMASSDTRVFNPQPRVAGQEDSANDDVVASDPEMLPTVGHKIAGAVEDTADAVLDGNADDASEGDDAAVEDTAVADTAVADEVPVITNDTAVADATVEADHVPAITNDTAVVDATVEAAHVPAITNDTAVVDEVQVVMSDTAVVDEVPVITNDSAVAEKLPDDGKDDAADAIGGSSSSSHDDDDLTSVAVMMRDRMSHKVTTMPDASGSKESETIASKEPSEGRSEGRSDSEDEEIERFTETLPEKHVHNDLPKISLPAVPEDASVSQPVELRSSVASDSESSDEEIEMMQVDLRDESAREDRDAGRDDAGLTEDLETELLGKESEEDEEDEEAKQLRERREMMIQRQKEQQRLLKEERDDQENRRKNQEKQMQKEAKERIAQQQREAQERIAQKVAETKEAQQSANVLSVLGAFQEGIDQIETDKKQRDEDGETEIFGGAKADPKEVSESREDQGKPQEAAATQDDATGTTTNPVDNQGTSPPPPAAAEEEDWNDFDITNIDKIYEKVNHSSSNKTSSTSGTQAQPKVNHPTNHTGVDHLFSQDNYSANKNEFVVSNVVMNKKNKFVSRPDTFEAALRLRKQKDEEKQEEETDARRAEDAEVEKSRASDEGQTRASDEKVAPKSLLTGAARGVFSQYKTPVTEEGDAKLRQHIENQKSDSKSSSREEGRTAEVKKGSEAAQPTEEAKRAEAEKAMWDALEVQKPLLEKPAPTTLGIEEKGTTEKAAAGGASAEERKILSSSAEASGSKDREPIIKPKDENSPINFHEFLQECVRKLPPAVSSSEVVSPKKNTSGLACCLGALLPGMAGDVLSPEIHKQRDILWTLVNTAYSPACRPADFRALASIYMKLAHVPNAQQKVSSTLMTGSHWEIIGFQSTNPETDLNRFGCMCNVMHVLYMLSTNFKTLDDMCRLSQDEFQNFPLFCTSIQFSKLTLDIMFSPSYMNGYQPPDSSSSSNNQIFEEDTTYNVARTKLMRYVNRLAKQQARPNQYPAFIEVSCKLHNGMLLKFYLLWLNQMRTIRDFDKTKKEIEALAKTNPVQIIEDLESFAEDLKRSANPDRLEFTDLDAGGGAAQKANKQSRAEISKMSKYEQAD